jgi:hypothetical protein
MRQKSYFQAATEIAKKEASYHILGKNLTGQRKSKL